MIADAIREEVGTRLRQIEGDLERLAATPIEDNRPKPDVEALNLFFREALDERWLA